MFAALVGSGRALQQEQMAACLARAADRMRHHSLSVQLRRSCRKPMNSRRASRPSTSQIFRSLRVNWRIVLIGTLMVMMTTVSFT